MKMSVAAKKFRKYQILMCWGSGMKYVVGKGHNSLTAARKEAHQRLSNALKNYKQGAQPWVVVLRQQITMDAVRVSK